MPQPHAASANILTTTTDVSSSGPIRMVDLPLPQHALTGVYVADVVTKRNPLLRETRLGPNHEIRIEHMRVGVAVVVRLPVGAVRGRIRLSRPLRHPHQDSGSRAYGGDVAE